jgi:hypothetical protein
MGKSAQARPEALAKAAHSAQRPARNARDLARRAIIDILLVSCDPIP